MKRRTLRPLVAVLLATCAGTVHALDVKGLDPTVGACTDFYQYANRKWLEGTEIPGDRTFWGAASIIARQNEDMLIRMLDDAVKQPLPPVGSPTRKVIEYYERGMNEAHIRHWQLKPLSILLSPIAAVSDREAMARIIGELHTRGIFPGFGFEVELDRRVAGRYVAEIRQGGLGLPDRDYYVLDDDRSKQIRAQYRDH